MKRNLLLFLLVLIFGVGNAHRAEAGYSCTLGDNVPTVVDACGTSVCEYYVVCENLGQDSGPARGPDSRLDFEAKAYCPRVGRNCAPYSQCRVPGGVRPLVEAHLRGQCDKFRSASATRASGPAPGRRYIVQPEEDAGAQDGSK
jgi:hypothetical protein